MAHIQELSGVRGQGLRICLEVMFLSQGSSAVTVNGNQTSIKGTLKNNFLLLWRRLILIFKRTKNQLWRFCNPIGLNFLWDLTSCKIFYWRLRRWKLNIQLIISRLRERFANWMNYQLVAFSSTRKKYLNSLEKRLIWTSYK